ncbi:diguanylate cyclase [Gracilibacillus massiliensis]|uniref:diguanylate cyclase n=1 Tax=Gracilibacillus massiliensis TaxID=1564956 RepID=UPI00071CFD85|nr:diguanylate cyclase [Gracilibacillus massiliensis]
MDYLVQFQLNIFALMVLVVLYIIIKMKARVKSFGKKLLKILMMMSAVAIIIEPLTWIFDGMQFPGAYFLEYSTNFILFMMGPIIGGLLLAYVDYHIFKDPQRVYKKGFYQHLSILTFVILIINIFHPVYFNVEPVTNSYSSGDFKSLHYFVLASLYIYMLYFLYKNKDRIHTYVATIFIIFFMLPIIGMVVQLFDSKLYFSWTSIVLAILVAYIFLETTSTEEDFLTKLYNRQSYETYLQHLLEENRSFGILLIDLNYFKEINDQYGHDVGDHVLIEFATILKKVFSNSGFVSRLGGDEFIVVVENQVESTESLIADIRNLLQKNNNPFIQQLSFSYGYQTYNELMTVDELYSTVDKKMYQYKREMKTV